MEQQLHPRNVVFLSCRDKLPTDIIRHISKYFDIVDRIMSFRTQPYFEKKIISQITECRDEDTYYANFYTKYYDTIIPNPNNKLRLSSWICDHHTKDMIEYRNKNTFFFSKLGIIHDKDEIDDDDDVMMERFIYIQLLFDDDQLIFINKHRRLLLLNLLKTFQKYGFNIESDWEHYSMAEDYFYISKTLPLHYGDLLDKDISSISKQYSVNTCFTLLLDMHDDLYNIFYKDKRRK